MIDFAQAWHDYLCTGDTERLSLSADLAFWNEYARQYDAMTALPGSYKQTLKVIKAHVRPNDMLLDIGAGTGRFALPLARHVQHITALDQSASMLSILRHKMQSQHCQNIRLVEATLEDSVLEQHDVVLAAWSLYRQLDLCTVLHKLVEASRRALVMVAGDSSDPPHRHIIKSIWGCDGEPDVPAYLYILGVLRQIGILADLRIVHETRAFRFASPEAAAAHFCPLHAAEGQKEALAHALVPMLDQRRGGWHYTYTVPVGILIWLRR